LVLRAGGTNTRHGTSTLIDIDRDSRKASESGFNDATNQMIGNFDTALTTFEADVRAGKANVRVVARDGPDGSTGGGGAIGLWEVLALLVLCAGTAARRRSRRQLARSVGIDGLGLQA
jgi:rhombotail lipoprotein